MTDSSLQLFAFLSLTCNLVFGSSIAIPVSCALWRCPLGWGDSCPHPCNAGSFSKSALRSRRCAPRRVASPTVVGVLYFSYPSQAYEPTFLGLLAVNLMAVLSLLNNFVCSSDKGIWHVRSPAQAIYTFGQGDGIKSLICINYPVPTPQITGA